MKNCLKRKQILRRKCDVQALFNKGKVIVAYPIKCVIADNTEFEPQLNSNEKAIFLVPKKIVKKATQRNIIRRRIKEAYRVNQIKGYYCAFVYIGDQICNYNKIKDAIDSIYKKNNERTSDCTR